MQEQKTNVMRVLQQQRIPYTAHAYPHGDAPVDGLRVAELTGLDPEAVFKTLVTQGASKRIYVFVIPVGLELELKKAARAAGEKAIALTPAKEISALTGYVRGGCSPIGMKKQYRTFYHSSISSLATVTVSAGKIGAQVELSPEDLIRLTRGSVADVAS